MVSSFDVDSRLVRHRAVNACLAPLCSVDWCAVTTVEGIGSVKTGLHPVQGEWRQGMPCPRSRAVDEQGRLLIENPRSWV